MMKRLMISIVLPCLLIIGLAGKQDEAAELVRKVRAKLDQVRDYKASGKLRTDVHFIKVPESEVEIYYKKPDRFKIRKEGGISILPKGGVSFNMNTMLTSGQYTIVPAGQTKMGNTVLTVVKLLPLQEDASVVLTTLYIDARALLIRKATTTTKDNGSYEMELVYGKYGAYGLPDKVVFTFNTRDYKLPRGVTLEYDNNEKPAANAKPPGKGTIELSYSGYVINKGVPESVFK